MSLSGKTALVTGGGRGIGRAIAERLSRAGLSVIVAGRTRTDLDEVARSIDGAALVVDLADRRDVDRALSELSSTGKIVDVLINNAGIAESSPFADTTDEAWDRMMAVNVTAPFSLARRLLPSMVERRWGRIVNIASNAGITGYAYTVAYCASKHALVGLTRGLAMEIAESGVTVNAVCPGWVDTKMVDDAVARIVQKTGRSEEQARRALSGMSPQKRFIAPEEVAHVVLSLLPDEARGIHGQAIPIDGGQVMS
jgi:3-hydroxybutyrate dehydrogenase